MTELAGGPAGPVRDARQPRIGARVRSLIDDGFITPGLTGRVTNRVPTTASVRVLWDNDTASIVKLVRLELLEARPAA
jgi:hypothetical protein